MRLSRRAYPSVSGVSKFAQQCLTGWSMPGRGGRNIESGGCLAGSVGAGMNVPIGFQLIGAAALADEALMESSWPASCAVPPKFIGIDGVCTHEAP